MYLKMSSAIDDSLVMPQCINKISHYPSQNSNYSDNKDTAIGPVSIYAAFSLPRVPLQCLGGDRTTKEQTEDIWLDAKMVSIVCFHFCSLRIRCEILFSRKRIWA